MSDRYADIARRGFGAVARGDFDVLLEHLHPHVVWHGGDPSAAGACRDREEVLEFIRGARARGAVGELVQVVGEGDRVVVVMRPPAKPGGQARLIANLMTFRDGEVGEMVHFARAEDAFAATGIPNRG
jgi:ketosteroid isomerase-like protein